MNAIWWLMIVVAALVLLWFAFGREGRKVGAGAADRGQRDGSAGAADDTAGRPRGVPPGGADIHATAVTDAVTAGVVSDTPPPQPGPPAHLPFATEPRPAQRREGQSRDGFQPPEGGVH